MPYVRDRCEHHGSLWHDRLAQGLWARRPGDGRGELQGAVVHGGVADRGVRRHGVGGFCAVGADRTSEEVAARMSPPGRAVSPASYFEIDDVIAPADSRRWIATTLSA